ncbi:MAG: dTMP kinase [Halieaceae bacterium]|jgi:dTMP kinase
MTAKTPPPPGKFITIEGGEGVGKSTNADLIQSVLESRGCEVVVTREPGGTALGEALRSILLSADIESPVAMAELLIIFAARAQHLTTVIEPALAAGKWVLCDRFTDATYAYQGWGRNIDQRAIASLEQLVQGARRPDLTVLLDMDPSLGLARAKERAELDRFEQEELAFFNRVREGYLARAKEEPAGWLIIDASKTLDEVTTVIGQALNDWFDNA